MVDGMERPDLPEYPEGLADQGLDSGKFAGSDAKPQEFPAGYFSHRS
jgi:hypothetical protein